MVELSTESREKDLSPVPYRGGGLGVETLIHDWNDEKPAILYHSDGSRVSSRGRSGNVRRSRTPSEGAPSTPDACKSTCIESGELISLSGGKKTEQRRPMKTIPGRRDADVELVDSSLTDKLPLGMKQLTRGGDSPYAAGQRLDIPSADSVVRLSDSTVNPRLIQHVPDDNTTSGASFWMEMASGAAKQKAADYRKRLEERSKSELKQKIVQDRWKAQQQQQKQQQQQRQQQYRIYGAQNQQAQMHPAVAYNQGGIGKVVRLDTPQKVLQIRRPSPVNWVQTPCHAGLKVAAPIIRSRRPSFLEFVGQPGIIQQRGRATSSNKQAKFNHFSKERDYGDDAEHFLNPPISQAERSTRNSPMFSASPHFPHLNLISIGNRDGSESENSNESVFKRLLSKSVGLKDVMECHFGLPSDRSSHPQQIVMNRDSSRPAFLTQPTMRQNSSNSNGSSSSDDDNDGGGEVSSPGRDQYIEPNQMIIEPPRHSSHPRRGPESLLGLFHMASSSSSDVSDEGGLGSEVYKLKDNSEKLLHNDLHRRLSDQEISPRKQPNHHQPSTSQRRARSAVVQRQDDVEKIPEHSAPTKVCPSCNCSCAGQNPVQPVRHPYETSKQVAFINNLILNVPSPVGHQSIECNRVVSETLKPETPTDYLKSIHPAVYQPPTVHRYHPTPFYGQPLMLRSPQWAYPVVPSYSPMDQLIQGQQLM